MIRIPHTLKHWLPIVFAALVFASPAMGQSGAGAITGTVSDASGAVVSHAKIHVANQSTGVNSDATTNGAGFFQVPGLFTGNYTVTVQAPGMTTFETSIQLLVSQTAVIHPVLKVGSQVQQLDFTADVAQLTTPDSASITSTLEDERMNQLPENGRSLPNLIALTTPGLDGSSPEGTMLNGIEGGAVSYVADGVPLDNRQFGGEHRCVQCLQRLGIQQPESCGWHREPAVFPQHSASNSTHVAARLLRREE